MQKAGAEGEEVGEVAHMFDQDDTENWEAQTEVAHAALTRSDEILLDYTMGLDARPLVGGTFEKLAYLQ